MKYLQRLIFISGCLLCLLIPTFSGAIPIGSHLCKDSAHYTCYTIKRGDTWANLFTNQRERDLVMRVNRMNIPLYRGLQIAIPNDLYADVKRFSPFPEKISPPGQKVIYVSLHPLVLAWGAYDSQGYLEAWGPAVGARGYCPDTGHSCHTALGHFTIYRKQGAKCVSTRFPVGKGGAPMPWCMFFHGGYALHGSYEVPGFNASHGCVRLFVPDAEWLNQVFTAGDNNVMVIVTNTK